MKKVLIKTGFISLVSLFYLQGMSQSVDEAGSKPPTALTQKLNEAVYKSLDFADSNDLEDANRGFIATIDSGIIRGRNGSLVVNHHVYDFIKGKSPASVNPALWRQAQLNNINGLFKVAEGIYQFRSFDIANTHFVETKTGYIVIDALLNADASAAAYALVKKHVADKPILAVIVTHSHADHYGGLEGLVSAEDIRSGKVKFITPKGFYEEAVSENVLLGNVMRRRAGYQFGSSLSPNEYGQVDIGLAKAFFGGGRSSLLQPNMEIGKTGETLTIDGIQIIFQLTPNTEAPAELTLYLPEKKAFFSAELASHSFHNVLTPRGAKDRDAKAWAFYLDEAIDLFGGNTEIVIPSHTWPVYGHERSIVFLEKQRDLYKYLHDQTVHLANKGLNMDEIAEQIKLPESLSKEWYNQDFYGTLRHNAKAVYQFYLGWWDGNPADYNKLPQEESAKKYVDWMGGEELIVKKAKESYDKGEYRWVAQVLKEVVFANPKNKTARDLQADAFEQIAYQSESGIWRDIYLSGAKELRDAKSAVRPVIPGSRTNFFLGLTPEAIFDYFSIALDGNKAAGKELSLRFIFPELNKNILVYLKNGVLHQTVNKPAVVADFTLTATKAQLAELFTNPGKAAEILHADNVKFEGNPMKLKELGSYIESFNPDWNIITP